MIIQQPALWPREYLNSFMIVGKKMKSKKSTNFAERTFRNIIANHAPNLVKFCEEIDYPKASLIRAMKLKQSLPGNFLGVILNCYNLSVNEQFAY